MTVAELIDKLKTCPQDAEVIDDGAYEVKSIVIYKATDTFPAQVAISLEEPS